LTNELDIHEVLTELGLSQGSHKGDYTEYYCPVHDSSTPDLCVYQDDFTCYSSADRSGGNAISLLMHCKEMNHIDEAKEWIQDHFPEKQVSNISEEKIEKRQEVRELLDNVTELAHTNLKNSHKKLYNHIKKNRNFDDQLMKEAKIGFLCKDVISTLRQRYSDEVLLDSGLFYEKEGETRCQMWNRIVFPYMRGGQTWYMIGRKPGDHESVPQPYRGMLSESPAKYKKLKKTEFNKHIVYQWQEGEDKDTVVITEGVTDAISAHKAGFNVSSPVTTRYSDKDIERVCDQAKHFTNVYIAMDADEEGKKGAKKTAHELAKHGIEAQIIELEDGDLDDYTTEHGYDLTSILSESEYYIDILLSDVEDSHRTEIAEKKNKVWSAIDSWSKSEKNQVFNLFGNKADAKSEYREWKKQGKESREKQKKKEKFENEKTTNDSEENEEDEADITEKLEVKNPGEILHINPTPKIYVNQVLDTATESKTNGQGTIKTKQKFKVFEIQLGEGEDAETFKLLTQPYKQIHLGENKLALKKANLRKAKYIDSKYFKKLYKEKQKDNEDFSMSYEAWLKSLEGSEYIELQDAIDERSKKVVKELSNEAILQLCQEYLEAGWNVDAKLMNIMYPQKIQHKKQNVKPGNVSKYQPHTQMWTNTKVGKSKTGGRVGRKFDDATPAGLLGYADSDGKQEGIIDGLETPVFIDEFNFGSSSRQLNDQLLSLMEEGFFEQTKAGHSITTRFYGNLTYLANPKDGDLPMEQQGQFSEYRDKRSKQNLVSQFEELIQYLGMNIQAMASRFGIVIFDEEMERASPKKDVKLSDERFEKLQAFVSWVFDEVSKEYTQIEIELRDWLEQEYEEEYRERINELADETSNEKVTKFWRNHVHSYRHARGQALRMAVFQHIGNVINDDYSIEDIREEADNQWDMVKEINLESLENMTNATSKEMEISRAASKLNNYSPLYLRLFVKTIVVHSKEKDVEYGEKRVFDELKSVYNDCKHEFEDVSENSKYWKWSKLRSAVEENLISKRMEVKNDFGIQFLKGGGDTPMFYISVPERFENFVEIDFSKSDLNQSESSDESLKIVGSFEASKSGLMKLFMSNEDKYDEGCIPEKDIVNYYGRKFNGKKYNRVMDALSSLSSEGSLQEVSESVWSRK